ncbi:TetR/AcrR family transcriptional regulator [Pseudarthrobacter sp. J64]|uniref:TetR/AcrR family transcriptional regulator n=1 Tax=Pseudarthrobacter sp. J64 TaxID=3116485 RepID=UPI002E81FEE5|nr:TetR/AcrR family transcriptional regulator [Pseudarthrobacter sp. J64]MEE2569335.1 TetR/AcrR family transcriptional regulator [Pseudarthrobacter sp. J64]
MKASPEQTTAPAPSRRELNKAATRQAIAGAAMELLRSKGYGNFTVEDIAGTAGISRRTFFNYFNGIEAAVASVSEGFLDNVLVRFRLRPTDEPILESARAALSELADPMTVAPIAEMYSLAQTSPGLLRSELEAWDTCTIQITEALQERISASGAEVSDLYIRALASSVMGCGKAAVDSWFAQCGADLSPASLATLRSLLIESVTLLAHGFTDAPAATS